MDSAVARQTVRPSVLGSGLSIQRRETPTISQRGPPSIQRLGVRDALNYFADAANAIPGYRMFTIVLGQNPINMSRVERSAANILRAVVEFIPGGNLIVRALDAYGMSTLRSLEIADLVLLPRAFVKVGAAFAGFAGRFLSWALGTVMDLLQIIFEVVAPGVMPVLRRLPHGMMALV